MRSRFAGGDIGRTGGTRRNTSTIRTARTRRDNKCFDSRHEVMGIVDGRGGGAGRALPGPLAPRHWRRPVPGKAAGLAGQDTAGFQRHRRGPSCTNAAWRRYPEVRENEALHVASIRAAKSCIYMENQYFTSPIVAAELASACRARRPRGGSRSPRNTRPAISTGSPWTTHAWSSSGR